MKVMWIRDERKRIFDISQKAIADVSISLKSFEDCSLFEASFFIFSSL